MMGCDDRFHGEDAGAGAEAVAKLRDEARQALHPENRKLTTDNVSGGKRRQLQVGDVVDVEGYAMRITSILRGGRLMLKQDARRLAQFDDDGVATRAAMADDLENNARGQALHGQDVRMTPRVVLDYIVPALRAVR